MNRREELRRTLRLAVQSMSRTISAVRDQGHTELADELQEVLAKWSSTADRGVRKVTPRGRVVVPPIVPLAEFGPGRPPVGVEQWARFVPQLRAQYAPRKVASNPPALRVVVLRPLAKAGSRDEVPYAG